MKLSDLIEVGVVIIVVMIALTMLKAVFWYGLLIGGGYVAYKVIAGTSKKINK